MSLEEATNGAGPKTRKPRVPAAISSPTDSVPLPVKSRTNSDYKKLLGTVNGLVPGYSIGLKGYSINTVKKTIAGLHNKSSFVVDKSFTEEDGDHIRVWRLAPGQLSQAA